MTAASLPPALAPLLEQLGLRQMAAVLPGWLDRAARQELSYADFLHGLLEEEGAARAAAAVQRPTLITSNKSLPEWAAVVQDASLASALIDRLLHHGEVFYLKGPPWRLKGRALDANGTPAEAARA